MTTQGTRLQERIAAGKTILLAELAPPRGADPAPLRAAAKRLAGAVHAAGIADNRDAVSMSALAAASIVAAEGLEPILHVTTRDRNRIALVSEALGAQALGIRNILCTSGSHQTLGPYRAARNVYDVDSVQLLQIYGRLAEDGAVVGEGALSGVGPFCLGAVASPEAEPAELQFARLARKARAGATFLVTQPIFDAERFAAWWREIEKRGLHEKAAIVAGIELLTAERLAVAPDAGRPASMIPEAAAKRVGSAADPTARRAAAVELAAETIGRLAGLRGLRGFSICGDGDAAAVTDILAKSGLRSD